MSTVENQDLVEGQLKKLDISSIAQVIRSDWKRVNPAAKPYLDAMATLTDLNTPYGYDSGSSIVSHFMGNAQTWRGENARAVKKELNRRLHNYYHPNDLKS